MSISEFLNFSIPTEPNQRLCLYNLKQDSLALALHQIADSYEGTILVVTPDNQMANRLEAALKFFSLQLTVLNFPDWETLPYDHFSPHQDIISQRLSTLAQLHDVKRALLLVPITTLMQRIAPLSYIRATSLNITCGEKRSIEELRKNLQLGGYHCVSQVLTRGEFAVRGSILDIFPMGSDLPFRVDFADDEVDSIRHFDPDTQRSIEKIEKINLLPAREFPLSESAINFFRQQWRENFVGNPLNCPLYEAVSEGRAPAGVEYYLPLFFPQTQLLIDYLPKKALILQVNNAQLAAENFWKEINERYEQLRHDIERPILAPKQLYVEVDALFTRLKEFPRIVLQQAPTQSADTYNTLVKSFPNLTVDHKLEEPLEHLNAFLNEFLKDPEARVLFCVESAGRREVLLDLLNKFSIPVYRCETWQEFLHDSERIHIIISPLEEGFYLEKPALALISEAQLFGNQIIQKRQTKTKGLDARTIIRNLAELTEGNPVVHIDHGVGRYRGLQHLKIDDQENEFLIVEYAGKAKLYVPVSSLNLISRYSGNDSEHAPLHQLGSDQWEKAKRKAAEQMRDVAAELLDIYAHRAAHKGYAFRLPEHDYQAFTTQFPFTETQDQEQAIQQVIKDMTSECTMDRLICGDVGFGKTEVAMRAAFLAVQSNKQVAILVPTTLLAQQHYQNFSDRFAEWPVQIEMISRFRSVALQKKILERLQMGKIDILIGTHKLLSKELQFPRLGLLIIDEEHRFGVQQKERLKALRAEVDILSLTATPIPRTLNMALSGLRELSIIATPPARRLSIKTFVQMRNTSLIREAILRELLRGGQVYFLHNQVDSIEKTARELEALVPEARIQVAHGQLRETQLERVMADFYHQRFNVLVCTTIIETGIDVPSANTIIIDRADKFGLAQLHQLRGRVGRSHHQAYAYLMTPPKEIMTADAVKRLEAFTSLEDLGAGFTLAMHDLEIRGAGEVLGEQQSGNMHSIGFSLYMELLEQTVAALKSGKEPALKPVSQTVEIDLQISALIPENYLPDVHTRLILYKRIAHAKDAQELEQLQVEMIDRFGLLPQAVKNLFQLSELKLLAQKIGIKKIVSGSQGGRIEFNQNPNISPEAIIQLLQKNPKLYKLEGPTHLRFSFIQPTPEFRIKNLYNLLNKFISK
ncbi:transcription-repair coupling factor [Rickettsiella endosymbiont of Aleochara curtula]|uniref:transcription-repair coupling factor n=1 Tax=Rickettsiella endosymbiont of Aleochara curtula TaxID=3077936 RepID=UPI00313EB83F